MSERFIRIKGGKADAKNFECYGAVPHQITVDGKKVDPITPTGPFGIVGLELPMFTTYETPDISSVVESKPSGFKGCQFFTGEICVKTPGGLPCPFATGERVTTYSEFVTRLMELKSLSVLK